MPSDRINNSKNPFVIIWQLFLLADDYNIYTMINLIVISSILGALEALGALSIMPFISLVADSNLVETNQNYKNAFEWFQSNTGNSYRAFLIATGLLSVVIIFISAAYKTFAQYHINSKIENLRSSISEKLLNTYLSKNYEFFLNNL